MALSNSGPASGDRFVFDTHVHGADLVPAPFRQIHRLANIRTMPRPAGLEVLAAAGVAAAVVAAVGDPIVTRWYGRSGWRAVTHQLDRLRCAATTAGCRLARDAGDVRRGRPSTPAVLLAVEGADAIGTRMERVDELHARGVRVVVPIHLKHNQIGTTSMPWQRYAGPLPVRAPSRRGLSAFGRDLVARLDALGIVIDVSHADTETTLGIIDASHHPVVASHTGARSVQDFARYLSDEEATAIAASGGVIGLWPYFHRRRGVPDADALRDHAAHLAALVGADHLCIGTDLNGVPGLMAGYRGPADLPVLVAAMQQAGLDDDEVRGVLGLNFLRVLHRVVGA